MTISKEFRYSSKIDVFENKDTEEREKANIVEEIDPVEYYKEP